MDCMTMRAISAEYKCNLGTSVCNPLVCHQGQASAKICSSKSTPEDVVGGGGPGTA